MPEPTRRKIQAIAAQMGYAPDPALQSLIAYRRNVASAGPRETIAYVTDKTGGTVAGEKLARERCFAGARETAARLGYALERFTPSEGELTDGTLYRALVEKNIAGVLLAWHEAGEKRPLEFDCSRLSAVRIGDAAWAPPVHRVTTDVAANVRLSVRQALYAGYRRIGLILPRAWDDAADRAWSLGFMAAQERLPAEHRIPILYQERGQPLNGSTPAQGGAHRPDMKHWWKTYQPEIILGSYPQASSALWQLGLNVPEDVAFADLLKEGCEAEFAGLRQNTFSIGALAVETVVRLMQSHLRGIPDVPTTTLVQGGWTDGPSMPPVFSGSSMGRATSASSRAPGLATTAA